MLAACVCLLCRALAAVLAPFAGCWLCPSPMLGVDCFASVLLLRLILLLCLQLLLRLQFLFPPPLPCVGCFASLACCVLAILLIVNYLLISNVVGSEGTEKPLVLKLSMFQESYPPTGALANIKISDT